MVRLMIACVSAIVSRRVTLFCKPLFCALGNEDVALTAGYDIVPFVLLARLPGTWIPRVDLRMCEALPAAQVILDQ